MKTIISLVVCFIFRISLLTSLIAQPGMLDESFGTDGKVTTSFGNFGDVGQSVIVQPDGKIIVGGLAILPQSGGDFALTRYNVDGSLDSTFDDDGKVTTNINNSPNQIRATVLQPDGKILAVGDSYISPYYSFGVARYNHDGSLDNTFGLGGLVSTSLSGDARAYSVALQNDSKIVVVGKIETLYNAEDFAIVRYNSSGFLDGAFGIGGIITTDFFSENDVAQCVAIQTDGKILVAGSTNNGNINGTDFAVVRYNSDSSIDSTFGTNGKITTDFFGYADAAYSIVLQPDSKIILGGYCYLSNNRDFALARYTPDGNLDNSFDFDGKVNSNFSDEYDDWGYSVALQEDGKIILAGKTKDASYQENFGMVRYNTDGSKDVSFGISGAVIFDFDNSQDACFAATIQPDSKIVLAGCSNMDDQILSFAVARFISGLELGVLNFTVTNNQMIVYPNPIGLSTRLSYELQQEENITISCYSIHGKLIETFISNQKKHAGKHKEVLNFNVKIPTGYYNLVISNGIGQKSISIIKK